jgi:hypothetical protein
VLDAKGFTSNIGVVSSMVAKLHGAAVHTQDVNMDFQPINIKN